MNGFILIHVRADGLDLDCYQRIVDGVVTEMVDAAGQAVVLPDAYCSWCVTGELLADLP